MVNPSGAVVGQLRKSIVHKMSKLWHFAMSLIKVKTAFFFWYAKYCGISKTAAIDLESATQIKNWECHTNQKLKHVPISRKLSNCLFCHKNSKHV